MIKLRARKRSNCAYQLKMVNTKTTFRRTSSSRWCDPGNLVELAVVYVLDLSSTHKTAEVLHNVYGKITEDLI
jgi:hypothetical protein